jgi:hypothetical protein
MPHGNWLKIIRLFISNFFIILVLLIFVWRQCRIRLLLSRSTFFNKGVLGARVVEDNRENLEVGGCVYLQENFDHLWLGNKIYNVVTENMPLTICEVTLRNFLG